MFETETELDTEATLSMLGAAWRLALTMIPAPSAGAGESGSFAPSGLCEWPAPGMAATLVDS